jgi:hypothetical protein
VHVKYLEKHLSLHTLDVPRSSANRKTIDDQRLILGTSSKQSKACFVIGFVIEK